MLYENRIDSFLKENVSYGALPERRALSAIMLDEEQKIKVTDKIVATMYQLTLNKYFGMDFGTIPLSKGNIDKIKEYDNMKKAIDIIDQVALSANDATLKHYADTLKNTMETLEGYSREFTLGFIQENQMVVMIYNTIVTSLICGINFAITFIVDFIITPEGELKVSEGIKQKANSKDYILFKNLVEFNSFASEGGLKKLFNSLLKNDAFIGGALTAGVGMAAITIVGVIALIPIIRELIYFVFNLRMKTSEFFKIQSEFLELNIVELRSNNSIKDKDKNAIIKKQKDRIKTLNSLADKFELDFKQSNTETEKEINKKVSAMNVRASLNDVGDSSTTGSFGLV